MVRERGDHVDKEQMHILWFDQLTIDDIPLVGGKNASLGEMYRELTPKGVMVPNGFAVTAKTYRDLIDEAGIKDEIRNILSDLDTHDIRNLQERGEKVRQLILATEFPEDLVRDITEAYDNLCKQYGDNTDVAVRSSATAEDLPDASFAGQQETFLNIRGHAQLLEACKKCFASLFTNRAISYRVDKGFDHFDVALSIGVQKMVRSDLSTSGVMFSIDTETGFKDAAFITAAYGLGETVVQGSVNPDEYYVFKPTLREGYRSIISKAVGEKEIKMIYSEEGTKNPTRTVNVPEEERKLFALSDDEILTLAEWAVAVEDHYSEKAGHFKPMDLEWAKDGELDQLFIVQARPETVQSQKDVTKIEEYALKEEGEILSEGKSVGSRIGQGTARVIKDVKGIHDFKKGEVLVTDMTDPDWEPIMKIASAIVTNRGGRTCHAAIVSRELGIPCVVGTNDATEAVQDGQEVTVSCTDETGKIYDGLLEFEIEEIDLEEVPETRTHVMMNLGNPEQAFELSFLPHKGIGLAREEFIINSYIKIHPKALIDYEELEDEDVRREIDDLTYGYEDKKRFFVERLAHGVGRIAAAFYPESVILRFSDFKSNEYANLIGGKPYEPDEENPMLGWRGASRYYAEEYKDAFALECEAIKMVRDEMGLKNLEVMIPICRTVEEGEKVLGILAEHGLKRGEDGFRVNVMCEVPSNVILADQFLDIFDGFSIGSNDLTQFTLACDRDSELIAHVFDERNEAVKRLVKQVIDVANEKGKYIGICGDAPSTYPEFTRFLVECGIQSMSLSPDAFMKTLLNVAETEKDLQ